MSETVITISDPPQFVVISDTPAPSEIVQTVIEEIVVVEHESFLIVEAAIQGRPGADGASASFVAGETPSGAVNGSNATFSALSNFVPESIAVAVNGLCQKKGMDFNTSGTTTILFSVSPESGDLIQISYLRG